MAAPVDEVLYALGECARALPDIARELVCFSELKIRFTFQPEQELLESSSGITRAVEILDLAQVPKEAVQSTWCKVH